MRRSWPLGCLNHRSRSRVSCGRSPSSPPTNNPGAKLAMTLPIDCRMGSLLCCNCGSCTSPLRIFKPPQNRAKCPISTHMGGGNAMVSHHVVYQLVLFALFWLCVIWHLTRPKHPVTAPDTPADPESLTPKRHRSNEPKPFEGLTHKPHCALCEQETSHLQTPPPVAPDPMPSTNRRPRTVDTSMHFCPHAGCDYRGWLGRGNLRANGHPSGGSWRQLQCTACDGYFPEHHGTILHGKQAAVELSVRVLACLA